MVISPKSVLDPVHSIVWLGKQLVLCGPGTRVFVVKEQWVTLVDLWWHVALLPLSKKLAGVSWEGFLGLCDRKWGRAHSWLVGGHTSLGARPSCPPPP